MNDEERDRLQRDHKFHLAIEELEPDQLNKSIKDYYSNRSQLYLSKKKEDRDGCIISAFIILSVLCIAAIVILYLLSRQR
jgi:hypothetical protein